MITGQNTGSRRIAAVPKPRAEGRSRLASATPYRRSTDAVSVNCTVRLTKPRMKLNVPKNRVNASAIAPMRCAAPRKAAEADVRVCDRDNAGGGENGGGEDEEKSDRVANRAHEDASEQAAENCAERSPRADDAEHPLGLPRVELRVRKAP